MKRLLTTTATVGLLVAAATATAVPVPAAAGDVLNIIQDFDITDQQNVNNVLNGGAVSAPDPGQVGLNTANSVEFIDPSADTGLATGDSYTIQQNFDEEQIVTNDATATVGAANVAQAGTDNANLITLTDANGGSTNGDTYSLTQQISSVVDDEVASQRVENTVTANGLTGSVNNSSQSAVIQGNVIVLTDTGGGTDLGNTISIGQDVGSGVSQVAEQVALNTARGTAIDGLAQSATQRANQVDLALSSQTGTANVSVNQNTTESFNQSIVNTANAGAGGATNVSQIGSNFANIVNVP